jgi:hypothetical protein
MIPPFNDDGYLPPGIYQASLAEIEARFGQESEIRHVQMESIRWLVDLAMRAGVRRVVLNGSFVTDIIEPNDVDCVLLVESDFPTDAAAASELKSGLPFVELKVVGSEDFDLYVKRIFASDRVGVAKGMLEVIYGT